MGCVWHFPAAKLSFCLRSHAEARFHAYPCIAEAPSHAARPGRWPSLGRCPFLPAADLHFCLRSHAEARFHAAKMRFCLFEHEGLSPAPVLTGEIMDKCRRTGCIWGPRRAVSGAGSSLLTRGGVHAKAKPQFRDTICPSGVHAKAEPQIRAILERPIRAEAPRGRS